MVKRTLAALVVALGFGGGTVVPAGPPSQADPPSQTELPSPAEPPLQAEAWQAAIDRWARVPGHHGVSASVVLADGSQWVGVAGLAAADEPLRADHLIAIASITKTMTAAVILQLVDDGVIYLDDPITRWLAPRPYVDDAITVRQLLNHSNGLANYTTNPALRLAIDADPSHVFSPDELLSFVGPPQFAPGAQTEYTNTAFLLLGQIAESATKRSILELYRQRLWAPLELSEIFMPGVEEPAGPVAATLGAAGLQVPTEHPAIASVGHSAFGLMSNARTIARWGHALFSGHVVSPAMQDAMRELVPAAGNILGETGAGLGIRSYHYLDRVQYGHSGGSVFGSSLLLYDVETGVTVAVLMNQAQGAHHFGLAPTLLALATP